MHKSFIKSILTINILILILLTSIGLVTSQLPNDLNNKIDFTYSTPANYSLVNVNNSIFWQGHTGTDGSWLTGIGGTDTWALNLTSGISADLTPQTNIIQSIGSLVKRFLKGWFQDLDITGTIQMNQGNITNITSITSSNSTWGYWSNSTCIVIGSLNYISQC